MTDKEKISKYIVGRSLWKFILKHGKLASLFLEDAILKKTRIGGYLHNVNFKGADLSGADLTGVNLKFATISETTNITNAKGLAKNNL